MAAREQRLCLAGSRIEVHGLVDGRHLLPEGQVVDAGLRVEQRLLLVGRQDLAASLPEAGEEAPGGVQQVPPDRVVHAVDVLGRVRQVLRDVPPELAGTPMFGWDALYVSTSVCIFCAAVSVCACQKWMVTGPVGVAPEGDEFELEPGDLVHAVSTRARTETPARTVRFMSPPLLVFPWPLSGQPLTAPVIACTNRR